MTGREIKYQGLERACFFITLDNGGLNRFRSEKQVRKEMRQWLAQQPDEMLAPVDKWLAGLSTEEMENVCGGEEGEMLAFLIEKDAPPFTDDILQRYFEEVC